MKSWQPHQRLLIYLLLAVAITCIISPFLSLGADWFMAQWPALMPQRMPFRRTFNRAFMISAILLFILCRRSLMSSELKQLCLVDRATASRGFAAGLGLALATTALLVAAMTVAEVFTPFLRLSRSVAIERIAGAAVAAIFAGVSEEIFFRGILFWGLRTHCYNFRAYLWANLFYSALHFVNPGEAYFLDRLELTAGFRYWLYTFTPFLDPLPLLPGFLGLFLIGLVLSFAVERAGNLYLAVGLHAGWVFGLKTLRVFGDFQRERLGWLFGASDPKIVSGVVTWMAILLAGLAVYFLTKSRAVRSSDLPRAITV